MHAVVDNLKVIAITKTLKEAKEIANQKDMCKVIQVCRDQTFEIGQILPKNLVRVQIEYENAGSIIF